MGRQPAAHPAPSLSKQKETILLCNSSIITTLSKLHSHLTHSSLYEQFHFGFLATFWGQLTPVWSLSSSSLIWVQPLAQFLTPSSSIEYLPLTFLWFQSLRPHSVHTIPLLHIPAFPCQFWCAPELFPGPLLFIPCLLPLSNIFPCSQHSFPLLHGWLYSCSEPNSPSPSSPINCLSEIKIWFTSTVLLLNSANAKFLLVGTKSKVSYSQLIALPSPFPPRLRVWLPCSAAH